MKSLSEIYVAPSIAAAQADTESFAARFAGHLRSDVARWKVEAKDIRLFSDLTQRKISGRALLSNKHVHRAAQFALIDAAADKYLEDPDRQWLWITMAWDAGVTWERSPEIDLVSLKTIAYQHLMRAGIEGFGVIETDTWRSLPGEPGRRMVAHVHFLGTATSDGRIKVTELASEMGARRALTNGLGARSVVIRNVGPSIEDFTRIAAYMLKRPCMAKDPIPCRSGEGYRLQNVSHAPGSVARLIEVFSHCEVGDVIFSIGSHRDIAERVRAAVRQEITPRAGVVPAPSADEVASYWKRIRETCGSRHFGPCSVITRAHQR